MWDFLLAFAQVLSVVLLIAGFGLATWYSWSGSAEEQSDE